MVTKTLLNEQGDIYRSLEITLKGNQIQNGRYSSRSRIGYIIAEFENKGSSYSVSESVIVRGSHFGDSEISTRNNLKFDFTIL